MGVTLAQVSMCTNLGLSFKIFSVVAKYCNASGTFATEIGFNST